MREGLSAPVRLHVRSAAPEDSNWLAPLFRQLGYPVNAAEIAKRLDNLAPESDVLVAVADSEVVGFVVIAVQHDFVGGTCGAVLGLVVSEEFRSKGIGSKLLSAAESWAFERGAPVVNVRSNVLREDAHRFYERQGYSRVKSQHVFEKTLR
jgi:GNAT superfamily N-acetyltransferase